MDEDEMRAFEIELLLLNTPWGYRGDGQTVRYLQDKIALHRKSSRTYKPLEELTPRSLRNVG